MSFIFKKLNAASTSSCTGVSWGHYMMTDLPVGPAGTDSMASCFAFIYYSRYKYSRMFLMAHVATDAETEWLLGLNLNQNSRMEKWTNPHTWFAIVTGSMPQEHTTMMRIGKLQTKYNIAPNCIMNNRNSDRSGVHVAGVGSSGSVVVTSCKSITANNSVAYTSNANLSVRHPAQYLRPMSSSDSSFYQSTFESGE